MILTTLHLLFVSALFAFNPCHLPFSSEGFISLRNVGAAKNKPFMVMETSDKG